MFLKLSLSTIHQIHSLTDFITLALEKKQYSTVIYLDVKQAVEGVYHEGLI